MSTNRKEIETKATITHLVDKIPNLSAIYLFGSWGTKYERLDSDLDIAVLAKHPLKVLERVDVAQELAQKLGINVDLIDIKSTTTVMQIEIVAKGSRIYCVDSNTCEVFEDFVYSSYARLNEERAGILQDIRDRGSVYG